MNIVVTQTAINASVSDQNISTSLTETPISVVASVLGVSASLTQTQINASISQGQGVSVSLYQSPINVTVSSGGGGGISDAPFDSLLYGRRNGAWVNITGTGGGSSLPVADTQTIVMGSVDPTKLLRFEVDGFSAGVTRVLTPPNQDILLAGQNFLNVFTVNQQMDAHLAVGANANVANPGQLLFSGTPYNITLSVEEEYTGTPSGAFFIVEGGHYALLANPGASVTLTNFIAVDASVYSEATNTQNINVMEGVGGGAQHRGSGNVTILRGLEYFAYNSGSGIVARQEGIFVDVENYGNGAATELTGISVYLYSENTDNQYGIYIFTDMGTVVNSYGIYLEDVSGASSLNYAIYTNRGDIRLGDRTFIDGSTNNIQLRVQGHSTQTANLQTWETSAGTVRAFINSTGSFQALGHSAFGANAEIDHNIFPAAWTVTSSPLAVYEIVTSGYNTGIAAINGIVSDLVANPSSSASNTHYRGLAFRAASQAGNSQPIATILGISGFGYHSGDGDIIAVYALDADVGNSGAGDVDFLIDIYSYAENYGSGIVDGFYLRYAEFYNGGTVNTVYGDYIFLSNDGGSATTAYGIYMEDVTLATTDYAIFTNRGDIRLMSSALDKLGFHGATPVAKQTVTGSRGGNAALADLLTKLANLGLITNSTSA